MRRAQLGKGKYYVARSHIACTDSPSRCRRNSRLHRPNPCLLVCAPPSPQEALAKSEAVFAGKVVAVSGLPPSGYNSTDPRVVAFKVSAVWKGPSYETMFITTPLSGASCGFDFIEGKSYIVYAWNGVDVLLCSRTKLSDNARDDFATLGEGSSPEPGSSSPVPKSRPDLVPPSGCELPFGYVRGHIDLSAFGLIAPLAWLAWRRRPGK